MCRRGSELRSPRARSRTSTVGSVLWNCLNTSRAIRLTRDLVTDPPAARPSAATNRPVVFLLGAI